MTEHSTREDPRAGFTFFPADWLGAEELKVVSLAAKGLWIGLICLMSRSPKFGKLLRPNGRIPDSNWIAKQVGCLPLEVDTLLAELLEETAYSIDGGAIICRRMWRRTVLSDVRSEAGRAGAEARWQEPMAKNGKGMANVNGKTMPQHWENDGKTMRMDGKAGNGTEGKGKERAVPKEEKDFEAFWSAYPKKVGKKEALKQWTLAKDKPDLAAILAALEKQKASERWTKDGGQFILDPERWIKKGRWADEVGPVAGKAVATAAEKKLAAGREALAVAFAKVHVGDKATGPEGEGVVQTVSNHSVSVKVKGLGFVVIEDLTTFGKWAFGNEERKP